MDDRPTTLIGAARVFWRSFAPLWAFPVVSLLISIVTTKIGHPLLGWWLLGMPLFFWCFFRAARPWLDRHIRFWHQAFWVLLVPFALWIVVINLLE
jgi:hypothetical protein